MEPAQCVSVQHSDATIGCCRDTLWMNVPVAGVWEGGGRGRESCRRTCCENSIKHCVTRNVLHVKPFSVTGRA